MPKKRINDKVTQIPPTNNDNENICDSNTQSIIEPQENITEILAKPTTVSYTHLTLPTKA